MAKKIVLITGGGSGIGQALAWHLADRGNTVLVTGRRLCALEKTKNKHEQNIQILRADVSKEKDREKIAARIAEQDYAIRFLVHNAALLEPVKPLLNISLQEWREHMAVNVEGPLFLTQSLLPYLQDGRILHISSGAAHNPYQGWGAYCTSKAALYMIYQVLRLELAEKNILVGSVRPGVVDTPMQDRVRQADKNIFPDLEKFEALKAENKLYPAQTVARFLAHLLLETADDEFSAAEWDIRESGFLKE